MQIVEYVLASRVVRTALASAAVAVSGCSGDPPAQSRAAGIDFTSVRACELLTAADVENATGIAVDAGKDVSRVGGRLPMCNWPRAGSDTDIVLSLLVTQPSYTSFERYLAGVGDTEFAGADIEEVTGIGHFGAWIPEAMMLQAYGEAAMVQTYVQVASERDAREAAKTLAGTALGNVR